MFIYVLDLFGTMAFAVTGAFKAIEHKADIVGTIILATITGVAGGIMRDVIFSDSLPRSILDPTYIGVTVASGVAVFLLFSRLKKHRTVFLKFDAIGLGVFTMIGSTFAYSVFGLDLLAIVFAGVLTAVGGGILRDVFVNQMPIVFVKQLYVSTSLAGIAAFYLALLAGSDLYVATIAGIAATVGLRMVSMRYNWNLPRARGNF